MSMMRNTEPLCRGTVRGAGDVRWGLIGHPDEARGHAAVRAHDLVRVGAIEQHHGLAVVVDRGDDAADVLAERHACILQALMWAGRPEDRTEPSLTHAPSRRQVPLAVTPGTP